MLTPTEIDTLLARYSAMADAARANDWDQLAAIEQDTGALRIGFIERSDIGPPVSPESAAHVADGIRRILALDAEIRTHTDPFLSAVRKLLAGDVLDRAVRGAYGALAP